MNKANSYTNKLEIYGKVERWSNSPYGQHLRLIEEKTIWKLDNLLGDFEGKDVCVIVKLKA